MQEISKCTYRQFTTGFFYGKASHNAQIYDNNTYVQGYTYLGISGKTTRDGYTPLIQKNKFCIGDTVEIMKPSGEDVTACVKDMRDSNGTRIESCPHPGQEIEVLFDGKAEEMDIIRIKAN